MNDLTKDWVTDLAVPTIWWLVNLLDIVWFCIPIAAKEMSKI